MNRDLYRVVFNAARGLRMAVQETASSAGKGRLKATTASAGAGLATILLAGSASAQIVGAPNVPGNQRPTVLVAPNGVPLVNIQTPSAAGVSRNIYNQFNVAPNGAILNNSRTDVQTQLGGWVQGNPFLANGPARIILNEVNGGSPSQLRGYIEVGGSRAEVVIANPAGIQVDGAGFINASRATLTTGVPQMNAIGGLESFLVRGGTVTIDGAGLDASKTDYAAILARAVQANAGIWASELKVVAGANQVSADHGSITPTTGTGNAPTFALDVAALGGMYAKKIVLVGSEDGLGVRNAGHIGASAGQLIVTASGRLENTGTLQATAGADIAAASLANSGRIASGANLRISTQETLANTNGGQGGTIEAARLELASTAGDIDNRGGTLRQSSSAGLDIAAAAVSNTAGGLIGPESVAAAPSQPGGGTGSELGTGGAAEIGGGTSTPTTGSSAGSGEVITPAPYVPPSPGTLTASAGALRNGGGRIHAGGAIHLQSADVNNNGGTLSLASMAVQQPRFDNQGGTLNIANGFSANVGHFDNSGGTLNAGRLDITTTGDFVNVGGQLASGSDANLRVGGNADNTRGTVSATGALSADIAGSTNNTDGTLIANQGVTLGAGSLDNTRGSIQSAQVGVQVSVSHQLFNGAGGTLGAATDLGVKAGAMRNDGAIRGTNDATLDVTGTLVNDGSLTAGRHTTVTAGSLQGGSAGVLGAGVQNDGSLGATGDLRVSTAGALTAGGKNLAAGNLSLQGASVDLSGSRTSAANIEVTASQGDVVTSKAVVATPGTLAITANSNGAQTLVNDAGQLNAAQLALNVANIANVNGGQIVQTGTDALRIETPGTIDNSGGSLASNGGIQLIAQRLDNRNGTLTSGQQLAADVQADIDNRGGTLIANEAVTLGAESLDNTQGSIQSAQAGVQVTVANHLLNGTGGTLGAATDLRLRAGSMRNDGAIRATHDATLDVAGALANDGSITAGRHTTVTAGSLQGGSASVLGAGIQNDGSLATAGDLRVSTSGALTTGGKNLAAGDATLQGASVDLSNSQTSGANIGVTASQGDVLTSKATVTTPGTLAITANGNAAQTLLNDAGQLNAAQLDLKLANLANVHGGEIVQTGSSATTIAVSGTLANDGGRIASNGRDLNLQAATLTNDAGRIEHAGTGTLRISGGSYNGTGGQITGNGALAVALSGAFAQDGGTTSAKHITLEVGSLSNRDKGQIVQTGTDLTRIAVVGALDNSGGTIASNAAMNVAAGSLASQGGSIRAAGTSDLGISVNGLLDNSSQGVIGAGGSMTVQAGRLNNDNGSITAVEDLGLTVTDAATNVGGTLAANGQTSVSAATLDNSSGTVAAVNGGLAVTTTGLTTNQGGTLQAGGATTLVNGGLDNAAGKVFGQSLAVQTNGQALNNAQGTLAATTTVDVRSGALANDAGLIQSGGAMTIDTTGQRLGNTQAAGYATAQGGITSGDTLDIRTGRVYNTGGFIGSKGALTARTQDFTNTGGGTVLGQAGVNIDTQGAAYTNSGGQTLAVGDLGMSAGSVTNTGSLIRSTATTTLNAASIGNTATQGTDQGIEGRNVVIGTGSLDNSMGAIRADVDATVTTGGMVNNTSGLISAGNMLKLADPNAANPGAKTLNLVNTDGTLIGDRSLQIDAKSFSGDGTLQAAGDLGLALVGDVTNTQTLQSGGNLSYSTTGKLTNRGQLLAGQGTLSVQGRDIDNTAEAEMSGKNVVVKATGTLTNRGLIDSVETTRIDADAVSNIGTGRIYGSHVAIAAGTLTNDTETVDGARSDATIAARQRMDIGAQTIINREHALIFSGGDMAIGGSLDAQGKATGQGDTLNNLSADIEALGEMSIAMRQINNWDVHIQKGPRETLEQGTLQSVGIEGLGLFPADEVIAPPRQPYVWKKNPDGSAGELLTSNGFAVWTANYVTTADTATGMDPARIVSGGDMTLSGVVSNKNSRIVAGGTLTADNYRDDSLKGTKRTDTIGGYGISNNGETIPVPPQPGTPETIRLGAYEYRGNTAATRPRDIDPAQTGGASASASGSGGVSGGQGSAPIVEVPALVGATVPVRGETASAAQAVGGPQGIVITAEVSPALGQPAEGGASTSQAGATRTVPLVVRTRTPDATVPQASLFRTLASGSRYLVETDPRFANYREWLSSDYLLNNLGLDPATTLKRLGDGFYEQRLIREQVAQLTGYRYLEGFANDDEQYTALMNAGATFAKEYGLRPGIALTPAQMAQLTSDIVWLVEQTVTLPDGTQQQVLVPQVYVRVRPGDIDGSGALLSADATVIQSEGDVLGTGTIAGRSLVSIKAENIRNLGGRIAGGSVGLDARNDLDNIGGDITARDAAVLTAGRDINIQTTTQTAGSTSAIDRVAGVYVSNPNGVLIASAGRDARLVGAALVSAGSASVGAGRNIDLGTVREGRSVVAVGQGVAGVASESREVGSVIQAQGDVRLAAGNDLNIRAGAVASEAGAVIATARNDINLTAGEATSSVAVATQRSSKSLLKKSSSSTFDSTSTTDVLVSSLSGKSVALVAGNDINLQAAQLLSEDAMSLAAGRDVNLTTATRTDVELHASQQRTSSTAFSRQLAVGLDAGGPIGGYGNRKNSGNSVSASVTRTAVGTQLSAGSLNIVSGRDTTLQASTVVADRDVTMLAGRNLTIESAQNSRLSSGSSADSKSGFIGSWSSPGLGHVKNFGAEASATTTQAPSQVASLSGNVTLVAGNEYRQTASSVLAAGQAGSLAGGDVNILAKNVTINEAYNTEQTVGLSRSGSTQLGGSASFMGVSTDTLKGASSTVKAMGETGDGRMQALGAVNLAMSGKQAYDAAQALGGGGQLSYGVSVSLSRNTSQGTSFGASSEAVGSSVVGSNNVNIVATGAGEGSNIRAIGSTIAAGKTANLSADNDVTLEASRNISTTVGRNSSSGASVGVTFGAGAQNGFSIQLGVNNGQGRDNQNDIRYNATQVSGGKAVNISSGGDLNMRGGVVQAERVTADVGGNLNIESLQDVSVGQSRQSSSGFGVSLCIPPICYGAVATVSASAAGAKADGVYISPNTQSGIKAGDGGFDVKVAGSTDLKGAVIESTQAAVDAGKNSFSTAGPLTMTDLQNVSQSSGSSYAVSGSVSVGYTTAPTPRTDTAPARDTTVSWAGPNSRPGGSAGVGSYSGDNQTSVTRSGISGIAGDPSVRTGDNRSAGTLVKDWNTQAIIRDVQAQAQITQQFNQNAAREIGTYAGKKYEELKDTNPTEAAKWAEGGEYRVALHTAAGALSGGITGALGAGASAALMPRIGEAIEEMGLPAPVAQALGAVTAAAIGGVAGGSAGAASAYAVDLNNRQLHPTERELIKKLADDKARQLCAGDTACQQKASVYWTDLLEKTAKGQVDDAENAKNMAYLADLLATTAIPTSEGARGGVENYVQDMREAQNILRPYSGQTIVVDGVTQYSYGTGGGQPQTYFTATPEQQADPYINTFLGQAANPIVLDLEKRDEARLERFQAQNGSAVPEYVAEELLLSGAILNRGLNAVTRLAESLDVALAGKVVPSPGGNISAQKITTEGIPAKLTSADLNLLTQIEKLPNTTLQGDLRELVADNYFIRNGYTPLNGKCASNCFDGVYVKDGKVYISEVKPLNADGSIALNGPSGAGLPT